MNERIQQFAEQAGLYDEKSPNEVPEFTVCFEKFAELIVRECCKEITQEPFNAGMASLWLKEHFGIEE